MSIQEALYHQVPLVAIPITADQAGNVRRAERNGYAVKLNLHHLTKSDIVAAIRKVMTDKTVIKSINSMHKLFTDYYDQTPMEKGVNAVEYVLKHKNLDFLKQQHSSSSPWYQFYGFDIISFIGICVIFVVYIIVRVLLFIVRQCLFKKEKED